MSETSQGSVHRPVLGCGGGLREQGLILAFRSTVLSMYMWGGSPGQPPDCWVSPSEREEASPELPLPNIEPPVLAFLLWDPPHSLLIGGSLGKSAGVCLLGKDP